MRHVAAACLALVMLSACTADGDRPGIVVLPGMTYSIPYDTYDSNPVTGQTLLLPPEGTVPYGFRPFEYGPGADEAARAGRELTSPLPADEEAMMVHARQGHDVYEVFCKVCHGAAGKGDGPIIGRFPNPPSLLGEHARQMAEGQIYHVIYHGQGLMPGYGLQVPDEDRWNLVAYIRSLQGIAVRPKAPSGTAQASPPSGAPQADATSETPESLAQRGSTTIEEPTASSSTARGETS